MTSLKNDGQARQISVTRPVCEYLGTVIPDVPVRG